MSIYFYVAKSKLMKLIKCKDVCLRDSLQYDATRWNFCRGQGDKSKRLKYSTAMSLFRNHDLITLPNAHILLVAVYWMEGLVSPRITT